MTSVVRSAVVPLLALCVGLAGLAALEYRWTDQLARAEHDRLRTGMEAAGMRFADDLSRELSQLIWAFRPGPWASPDETSRLARQDQEWTAQANDRRLLQSLLVATDGSGGWTLRRLQGDRLTDAAWTPALEPVRVHLNILRGPGGAYQGPTLVHKVPALVIPSRLPLPPPNVRLEQRPDSPPPPSMVILVLDTAELREEVLPRLAARHFAGLDSDLAVISTDDPEHPVWTSRAGFPREGQRGDVERPLLGAPSSNTGLVGSGFLGPPAPPLGAQSRRPGAALTPTTGSTEPWRLVVSHRTGSLEAAVARTRFANLVIGTGGLILLGGSAILLARSGQRARALGRQQVAFVAAISHELRTPLAAIRSAGQNLADGVVSEPDQVRRYGEVVHEEGQRLTALVEQTLELSGMLAQERGARLEEVDPAALLREVLAELGSTEEFYVDVPNGLPYIVGNRLGLRSAVRNLIDNALKHGKGQAVAVRARLGVSPRGGRDLRLVVEDGGPGVEAADRARLFEPFYRGTNARAGQVPGSGLGLAVVRHVAEAHGGRVSVEPGAGGRGAVFTLHLPVEPTKLRA